MKRFFFVFVLGVASTCALADEASTQMILDSIHSKGFLGCDDEIRKYFDGRSDIGHVESKVPFPEQGTKGGKTDEVIVITARPGDAQYDWDSGIESVIFRKVGKQCRSAFSFYVGSSISRNCDALAKLQHFDHMVAQTDNASWNGYQYKNPTEAQTIYSRLNNGACRFIKLPE